MLMWAGVFLIIAIVAGLYGYQGKSKEKKKRARQLFKLALVIFLVLLVWGLMQMSSEPPCVPCSGE